jgi:hypothetical protein
MSINSNEVTDIHIAKTRAMRYSNQYGTFWYVRKVEGGYAPWAHSSDDENTVATYYCGKIWTID